MDIIEQTLKLLEVDGDFIVKNKTVKNSEITARGLITTVINDGGNTKISALFKGHDQIKIREAFKLVFFSKPKPSPSSEWYLHILSINGLKKCPACKEIKPLKQFATNSAMKSAKHDSWCKSCTKDYREINSDSIANSKAVWQQLNSSKTAEASARRGLQKIVLYQFGAMQRLLNKYMIIALRDFM